MLIAVITKKQRNFYSIPNFTAEEITAVADETIKSRKMLAAHAMTPDGIIYALKAGARTIEHGTALDDECIDLFVIEGCILRCHFNCIGLCSRRKSKAWRYQLS
ncbi:MAG: hypothetical protein U5K54_27670 [Cytophagales bacterium]|nr:hypothetical protein [Cytophagales bacterium]